MEIISSNILFKFHIMEFLNEEIGSIIEHLLNITSVRISRITEITVNTVTINSRQCTIPSNGFP